MTMSRHYIAVLSPNMTINQNQTKLAYAFGCIGECSLLLIDSSVGDTQVRRHIHENVQTNEILVMPPTHFHVSVVG